MNILVLCTGNSVRSILLEAILNRHSEGRATAFSAGSHPTGQVHPDTLHLLPAEGYVTQGLRSKSWTLFEAPGAPVMDCVITVCGSAASETCPIWPGVPVRAHWGVEDPAAAPPRDRTNAFRLAYNRLLARARMLLGEPFETLDRPALQSLLTRIGNTG